MYAAEWDYPESKTAHNLTKIPFLMGFLQICILFLFLFYWSNWFAVSEHLAIWCFTDLSQRGASASNAGRISGITFLCVNKTPSLNICEQTKIYDLRGR